MMSRNTTASPRTAAAVLFEAAVIAIVMTVVFGAAPAAAVSEVAKSDTEMTETETETEAEVVPSCTGMARGGASDGVTWLSASTFICSGAVRAFVVTTDSTGVAMTFFGGWGLVSTMLSDDPRASFGVQSNGLTPLASLPYGELDGIATEIQFEWP